MTPPKKPSKTPAKFTARELTPDDWPHIKKLFGAKGACGGCWCMHWRIEKGGQMWEKVKGDPNRKAFKKLVESGKALGVLAFEEDEPVGWCSFGKRIDFPRLDRVKAYRREDTKGVWSINCFFIKAGYRGKGLGQLMAKTAVAAIKKRRGKIIEAYPTTLTKDGKQLPAAFSYTGPEVIFERLGFKEIQRLASTRPLYRLTF